MFLILELVLIILLNKTYAYITQDSEIILLPAWNPTDAKEVRSFYCLFYLLIYPKHHLRIVNYSFLIVFQFTDTITSESFRKIDSTKSV
jgi:hypothetical protein